jgi:hypothetical protein
MGVDVYIHMFFISALVGGEWSTSRPGSFTPGVPWLLSIYLFIYGSTVLCWTLATFHFLNPIHSRSDSLDGGSAHSKATSYTQNITENKCTQITMPWERFEPPVPGIRRESQAALGSIKENYFHGAFEAYEKRWDLCKHSQGDCFEGGDS